MRQQAREPIAIIGVGCVLPGADSARADRYSVGRAQSRLRTLTAADVGFGGVELEQVSPAFIGLRGGVCARDWLSRFAERLPLEERAVVNPMQFLVDEAASQALNSVRRLPTSSTAVVLGSSGLGMQADSGFRVRLEQMLTSYNTRAQAAGVPEDLRERIVQSLMLEVDAHVGPSSGDNVIGSLGSVAAFRVCQRHGIEGPHYSVDADHNSALASIAIALRGLHSGEWDCVVTGAVSELLTPVILLSYAHRFPNLILGEGAVCFVLKRLGDALDDGETIVATIEEGTDGNVAASENHHPDIGHLRSASAAVSMLRATYELGAARRVVTSSSLSGERQSVVLGVAPTATSVSKPAARRSPEPIAVVGMGGVFAKSNDLPSFWRDVCQGLDMVGSVPSDRWDLSTFGTTDVREKQKSYCHQGAFLSGERFATLSSNDNLDPGHLLLLQAGEEARRDAFGLTRHVHERTRVFVAHMPFAGKRFAAEATLNATRFGVMAGRVSPDQGSMSSVLVAPALDAGSLDGWSPSMAAARLAKAFASNAGMNILSSCAVESACASVFAAIHAAALALRNGDCDVAVVGAFFCDIFPEFYVATCRFRGLSQAGIAPFSANATGFVPGEGAGVFVLKRHSQAVADDDTIRAVIAGIGGSTSLSNHVLRPTEAGEILAMQRALRQGQIDPESVGYIECHGTGTKLGDASEVAAIGATYGNRGPVPVMVGSVKSNLGHLCGAAGAPALAKLIMCLEQGVVPKSLHAEPPNPAIDFARNSVSVATEKREWPSRAGLPRRGAVSSFGIGGTNFHLVLEQVNCS